MLALEEKSMQVIIKYNKKSLLVDVDVHGFVSRKVEHYIVQMQMQSRDSVDKCPTISYISSYVITKPKFENSCH